MTAISAYELGFKVVLNTNAIGTTFVRRRDKYYKRLKKLGARLSRPFVVRKYVFGKHGLTNIEQVLNIKAG